MKMNTSMTFEEQIANLHPRCQRCGCTDNRVIREHKFWTFTCTNCESNWIQPMKLVKYGKDVALVLPDDAWSSSM